MKLVSAFEVVRVDVEDLVHNPVQPPPRTTKLALSELTKAIERTSFVAPIIVGRSPKFPKKFVICDGHRRLSVLQTLGIREVDCIVVPTIKFPVEIWFTLLNRGVRNVKGVDWFNVWAQSEDPEAVLEVMQAAPRRHIEGIIDFVGLKVARQYGQSGDLSPSLVSQLRRVIGLLSSFGVSGKLAQQNLTDWVIKHKMTRDIRKVYEEKSAVRQTTLVQHLKDCLDSDIPFSTPQGKKTRPRQRKK